MKLTIVTTLYQSALYIDEFYRRISKVARKLAEDEYEIIMVNDGSPDQSLDIAVSLAKSDAHLTVIDLSRNFGHHKAMMTGLAHAKGKHIFLIDSDLEEEPEWLPLFDECMRQESCDVVYGVQTSRRGGWFERISGTLFYKLFNLLSGEKLPANAVTARLMTRRYVDALLLHQERETVIAGIWKITGFQQLSYPITKNASSPTTYTLRKKVASLISSITSFSAFPLLFIFYLGFSVSLLASLYVIYLVLTWYFTKNAVTGWTSIIVSIWLLSGIVIMSIGIIGIYLAKIFAEVKQRPYTIIRNIYKKDPK